MVSAGRGFSFQHFDCSCDLVDCSLAVFHGRRNGRVSNGNSCTGGVQQADGLVGQLPSGNITAGELDRIFHGFVQNLDLVVILQRVDQTSHHSDGFVNFRFFHFHDLKPACQCGVSFEVLFIFGPCGGGDGSQFATCESRLEHVGGIALPRLATGTDQCVSFVDEQNDGSHRFVHFFDDALQPVFKLPFDTGTGLQQTEVERAQSDGLQCRRDISLSDF